MDVDGDIPAVAVSKSVLLISEMLSASLIMKFLSTITDGRRVTFGEASRGKARVFSSVLPSPLLLQCLPRFELFQCQLFI